MEQAASDGIGTGTGTDMSKYNIAPGHFPSSIGPSKSLLRLELLAASYYTRHLHNNPGYADMMRGKQNHLMYCDIIPYYLLFMAFCISPRFNSHSHSHFHSPSAAPNSYLQRSIPPSVIQNVSLCSCTPYLICPLCARSEFSVFLCRAYRPHRYTHTGRLHRRFAPTDSL